MKAPTIRFATPEGDEQTLPPKESAEIIGLVSKIIEHVTVAEKAGVNPGIVAAALAGAVTMWIDRHTEVGDEWPGLGHFIANLLESGRVNFGPPPSDIAETIQ